jgi:radical S-adenosyl methionine domain-containing protein 2
MDVERFNLAGGEPMLYSSLGELSEYIRAKGSEVSVITNGYCLSADKITTLKDSGVSMIGMSIDSVCPSTLREMGRCTKAGDILNPARCTDLCKVIKKAGMALKINTVISQMNYTEDFRQFMRAVAPDRWKIIKMKPFFSDLFDNSTIAISDRQFNNFVARHAAIPHVVERDMANAYILVDAFGNLVDNGSEDNHPVANLLTDRFSTAFLQLEFNYATYRARYRSTTFQIKDKVKRYA